ncbi:MAG TPA: glutathione S-transferase N-terminal domain-containing protein [Gaiellaceae bacterium]
MHELWQAEWCPHSHRIRQKMTELGLDFVARQVPADPKGRKDMERRLGTNEIPVLVRDEGEPLYGENDILAYLDRFDEPVDAEAHREKAEREVPTFSEVSRRR